MTDYQKQTGPDADVAEWSREYAQSCCVCRRCGHVGLVNGTVCADCKPIEDAEYEKRIARAREKEAADDVARDESLRKARNAAAARDLEVLMSDLSEDCWCASWLDGTEYALWSFVLRSEPVEWGMGAVDGEQIWKLRTLSNGAGGWWYWQEEHGLMFVDLDTWKRMYAEREVQQ
jgi:hypothetical protein